MDGNDIEKIIKAKLDGTFTKVRDYDGNVTTQTGVPLDYIPDHNRNACSENHGKRGPDEQPRHRWTPQDDAELIKLRHLGWSQMGCALHFGVTEESVRKRVQELRARQYERGLIQ